MSGPVTGSTHNRDDSIPSALRSATTSAGFRPKSLAEVRGKVGLLEEDEKVGELASLFLNLRPHGFTHEDLRVRSRQWSAFAHQAGGNTSPLSVMFQ
jgi:hypothetical protein